MKSLTEYMKGIESKKRSLEDELDQLNEDMAQLKAEPATMLIQEQDDAADQVNWLQSLIWKVVMGCQHRSAHDQLSNDVVDAFSL